MGFVLPVGADGSSLVSFIENLFEENGGLPVNVQDQTTRPFDIRMNQIIDNSSYSLASVPIIDSYDLILNTTLGLTIGDNIAFLEENGMPEILFGKILNIAGNRITLDEPVPHNYTPYNTFVFTFINDISVDGSTTKEVFEICNFFKEPVDIVRFIFHCTDNVVMHDGLFCGNVGLTRGIVLRKKKIDGSYINYWNVKNNGNWGELAFDTSYNDKGKPPDSTYGFTSRLTYGGQSKHGVVIRLDMGECIQVLVQDNLNSISTANIMVEGHFIQN